MAAPTRVSYAQVADWMVGTTPRSMSAALTWLTGDLVLVGGLTSLDSMTLSTPTVTGLTFALAGGPNNTATTSEGLVYLWQASAASGSSGTVQGTSSVAQAWGIGGFVWRNSSGIGTPVVDSSTAKTVSLTRVADNSCVIFFATDWGAAAPGTPTTVPAGGTVDNATSNGTDYTAYVVDFGDQGAAGTASYGISGAAASANWNKMAFEVKGSGGAAPVLVWPRLIDRPVKLRVGR